MPIGENGLEDVPPRNPPPLTPQCLHPGTRIGNVLQERQVLLSLGAGAGTRRQLLCPLSGVRLLGRPRLAPDARIHIRPRPSRQVVHQLSWLSHDPFHLLGPVSAPRPEEVSWGHGGFPVGGTTICVTDESVVVQPVAWTPEHLPVSQEGKRAHSVRGQDTLESVSLKMTVIEFSESPYKLSLKKS